ncbi:MAG: winged helix-turn-helix domain-containing protein [Chloroflexota bacterium]
MADPGKSSGYWSEFPATYRAEQIATIMQWVAADESGVVVGGSGTGKSNLAGFLGSRPDAIAPFLTESPDTLCLLRLDINSLPALTVPFFYRGLVQALQDASPGLGSEVHLAMQQLTQGRVNWDDVFVVVTILQKAHQLVIRQAGKKVVWLLDRFDEACKRLDAQTLSSLRSLRDQFKGRLCYILFTRHPLKRLRDPHEIDEFHEIVTTFTCRVGPMVERDARWIARQMAERLHTNFSESEVVKLLEVTGSLPAFLRLGCLALAEGAISQEETTKTWVEQLLTRPEFRQNCQEIWDDLTSEERGVLLALSAGANEAQVDQDSLAYLEQAGVLARKAPDEEVNIFSPILAAFIAEQHHATAGLLELHPKTRAVLINGIPLNVELTPQEDRLLSFFLEHTGEACEKDTLIEAVWPGEASVEGVSDDRLAQLITRLRKKIEPDPGQPIYIQTVRGWGYRLVQPDE